QEHHRGQEEEKAGAQEARAKGARRVRRLECRQPDGSAEGERGGGKQEGGQEGELARLPACPSKPAFSWLRRLCLFPLPWRFRAGRPSDPPPSPACAAAQA